jgi:transcription elongation factor GreA
VLLEEQHCLRGEWMSRQAQAASADISLGRAITDYLAELPVEERNAASRELHRLMSWFGDDRRLASLTAPEVEQYQERLQDSGVDTTARLEPVRQFLSYARQKKLTPSNLATSVRIRRKNGAKRGVGGRQIEEAPKIELTAAGYEQLKRELDRLENEEAPKVRHDLSIAFADKDFRENAPYDAAKQRLGEIQGRINELKAMLSHSVIVEAPKRTDRVTQGSTVTVRDLQEDEELTYTLVGPGELDSRKGRISISSPVGRALQDREPGDTVEVQTPAGVLRLRIENISNQ